MKKRIHIKLLRLLLCLLIFGVAGCGQKEADAVCIGNLRTEYRDNPIGIVCTLLYAMIKMFKMRN